MAPEAAFGITVTFSVADGGGTADFEEFFLIACVDASHGEVGIDHCVIPCPLFPAAHL